MRTPRVVVIGAGIGGLSSALVLAARGCAVTVLERASAPGGKMRQVRVAGAEIDAGPTVLTLADVFEELFAEAGSDLHAHVALTRATTLARHAWDDGARLDLFSDLERSAAAIADFAGAAEADRFRVFSARARAIHDTLDRTFMRAPRPSPFGLVRAVGPARLGALWGVSPFVSLWRALGEHFRDERLRQLFGRYATYVGSSPFEAPATLMLIAHVELAGVWLVEGGMHALARAVERVAAQAGAVFRYGADVREIVVRNGAAAGVALASGECIEADAVVANADVSAFAAGLFGAKVSGAAAATPARARSLSALTWSIAGRAEGFPLVRHGVFFSPDYRAEFDDLFAARRLPREPTVYVCAQDRDDAAGTAPAGSERLFVLVNAPALDHDGELSGSEVDRCEERTFSRLERAGLRIDRSAGSIRTEPKDFSALFPATGGAIYGRASHGWLASFARPRARTRLPGLYLAGGSAHPGAGVPMAALSARLAARGLMEDFASTHRSYRAATPGGTSTP